MRVALSIHHELSEGTGAPGATMELARALEARGHEVDIWSFDLLGGDRGTTTSIRYPHHVAGLVRKARDFDVVDASTGDLSWVKRRATNPLLVSRSHGLEPLVVAARKAGADRGELDLRWRYSLYHGGFRLREVNRSLKVADCIVVLSQAEADYCSGLQIDSSHITLGTSALPAWLCNQPAASPGDHRVLVLLGGTAWRKGADIAIAALEPLLLRHPDLLVRWLGANEGDVARLVSTEHQTRFQPIQNYLQSDLPQIFADATMALLCSRVEGMPLSLLEAAAFAVPVITSDIPGNSDLLHMSQGGLLVPVGNSDAASEAIEHLLNAPHLRVTLGNAAFNDVQTRTWDHVAASTEAMYRRAIESR
ncbi:MAG: glycosyltransferase family 4 protein, partial [Actinomycetota bacterium]